MRANVKEKYFQKNFCGLGVVIGIIPLLLCATSFFFHSQAVPIATHSNLTQYNFAYFIFFVCSSVVYVNFVFARSCAFQFLFV